MEYLDGKDIDVDPCFSSSTFPLSESCSISSLPPEILAHIFTLSLSKGRRVPTNIPFEVALSHVSSSWRGVALTTPGLWTKIYIYSNRSVGSLAHYLRRSGSQLLLDIYVDIYRYEMLSFFRAPGNVGRLVNGLGEPLLQEIHRLRSLTLLCYSRSTPDSVLQRFSKASASNLKCLVIKYDPGVPTIQNLTTFYNIPIINGGTPLLSFLDTELPNRLPPIHSLQNLTTLYLHGLDNSSQHTYGSLVQVLTAPRSLLYLSIKGTIQGNSWPLHQAGPQFELPRLKGLRLLDDSMMAVKVLLSMSAPELQTLWLDCSYADFPLLFDASQMATSVGRNKFRSLRYLTIPNDNFYLLENLAQTFPTITHLHLPHANFFHVSQLQKTLMAKWHSLHTLAFSMFRETKIDKLYSVLNTILPIRQRVGHPIRKVLVDGDQLRHMMTHASNILLQVEVERLDSSNYREIWWNKMEQPSLD